MDSLNYSVGLKGAGKGNVPKNKYFLGIEPLPLRLGHELFTKIVFNFL